MSLLRIYSILACCMRVIEVHIKSEFLIKRLITSNQCIVQDRSIKTYAYILILNSMYTMNLPLRTALYARYPEMSFNKVKDSILGIGSLDTAHKARYVGEKNFVGISLLGVMIYLVRVPRITIRQPEE